MSSTCAEPRPAAPAITRAVALSFTGAEGRSAVPAMMRVMALRDYAAWHDEYDRAGVAAAPAPARRAGPDRRGTGRAAAGSGPRDQHVRRAGPGSDRRGPAAPARRRPGRPPGGGRPAQRGRCQGGHRASRARRAHGHRGRRRPVRRLRRRRTRRPRPGLRRIRERQPRGYPAYGQVPACAVRSGRLGHLDQATEAGRDPAGHSGLVRGGRLLAARARRTGTRTCSAWAPPGLPLRRGRSVPGSRCSPSSSRRSD